MKSHKPKWAHTRNGKERWTTAQYWAAQALGAMDLESVSLIADEVACQFPSPDEYAAADVPEIAKQLRRELLARIEDSQTVEQAREHLFAFAEALSAAGESHGS